MTVSARTAPAPLRTLIDAVLREALRRRELRQARASSDEGREASGGERGQ